MVQGQRQLMIVGKNVELLNESKIAPIVLLLLASLCCNSLESLYLWKQLRDLHDRTLVLVLLF